MPLRLRSARLLPGLLVLLSVAGSADAEIVFSALQDGGWRLFQQSGPGSEPRPVVGAGGAVGDPGAARISPDGRSVAFEVTGGNVHVCPLKGEAPCRVVSVPHGFAVRPAWRGSAGELVFVHYTFKSDEEVSTLHRADASLEDLEPLIQQTGIQDFPDVSPDGARLAYTSWQTVMPYRGGVKVVQQIWTLELSRGRAGQLLLSNSSDIHPRWSPDGSKLAFSSNRSGQYEIWTVEADGNHPTRITSGPGDKTWPVWSPTGEQVLFTHAQAGRTGLSIVTLENGEMSRYQPFAAKAEIQLKDADWRAAPR